jgi:outer membrane protein TolC
MHQVSIHFVAGNEKGMRLVLVYLLLITIGSSAQAQVSIASVEELYQYADKKSPAARQARLQPSIAKQDVNLAASGLYPRVSAFATADYYPILTTQLIPAEVLGGEKGTYLKAQFGLPYVFMSGVELSLPVINMEKWSQLSRARAQYRQAEWGSKQAVENLHLQLVQAYYQVLVLREVIKLHKENVVTAAELMKILDARNEAGVLNPSDYNRGQNLQLDQMTVSVNYQKSLQQATNALKNLLNLSPDDSLVITDSLAAFSWPIPANRRGVNSRPALMEATARAEVASIALKESKRAALPKLNLNARYAYNMQTKFEDDGRNIEFNSSNINLRLDVPLHQGNYYRSLRKKNALLLQSTEIDKERIASQLGQQEQDWNDQYRSAYEKHMYLEQKLAVISDNLRIANLNMEQGVMEFDEYSNIYMEYNRGRMEYIQNLSDGVLYNLLSTQKF